VEAEALNNLVKALMGFQFVQLQSGQQLDVAEAESNFQLFGSVNN